MQIVGHDSTEVLDSVKTLCQKKTGFTESEFRFLDDLLNWHKAAETCKHGSMVKTERVLSNGTIAHYEQCLFCGWGKAVKKSDEMPERLWSSDSQEIRNLLFTLRSIMLNPERNLAINDDFQRVYSKSLDFQKKHREHLQSGKWKNIRRRVLDRANYTCEGCLSKPAQEVHHKTYDHLGNEFCFELIALCRDCHKRYHGVID